MKHKIWPWVKQNQSFLFPFIATNKLSTSKQLAEVKRKSKNKRKKSKKRKNNDNKNLPDNSYQNLSDKSENFNSLSHRPRIGTEPCIDSENDVSNTSFELTIDNTWIEYTRIHQLHAQKRDFNIEKFKLELSEKYDKRDSTKLEFPEPDYIDVKDINQYDTNFNPSSKTPNYRPNEIRKIQLNQLYGDDYAKSIAYMETALQNTFENY
ncbi:unnamed protein product, partial [Gordionus sp. m RMFG-2023]